MVGGKLKVIINNTHTIFSQEEAIIVAGQLNINDDDWTYVVNNNPDPDGPKTAIIEIYDEDRIFVSLF